MAENEQTHVWGSPFFRDKVADRVRFALTRYFSRKTQIADITYNDAIPKTGFSILREFAISFYAENLLKSGDRRRIQLKVNGKRYDPLFQRPDRPGNVLLYVAMQHYIHYARCDIEFFL